jgi:hypothetical protein
MAYSTFTKTALLAANPPQVYEIFAVPEHYIGLQPLITAVSDQQRTLDAEGNPVWTYKSREHFQFFGLIPYDNVISVKMTLFPMHTPLEIHSEVQSPGNVQLHAHYVFVPVPEGTSLILTITLEMPFLIQTLVVAEASRAQEAVLDHLRAKFPVT